MYVRAYAINRYVIRTIYSQNFKYILIKKCCIYCTKVICRKYIRYKKSFVVGMRFEDSRPLFVCSLSWDFRTPSIDKAELSITSPMSPNERETTTTDGHRSTLATEMAKLEQPEVAKLTQSFIRRNRDSGTNIDVTSRNIFYRQAGWFVRWISTMDRQRFMYLVVGTSMSVCVIFIAITSFAPEPVGLLSKDCPCEDGLDRCICPRETVQALTIFQMFCLANSRVSAYVCYPLFLLMCLTMAHHFNTW